MNFICQIQKQFLQLIDLEDLTGFKAQQMNMLDRIERKFFALIVGQMWNWIRNQGVRKAEKVGMKSGP